MDKPRSAGRLSRIGSTPWGKKERKNWSEKKEVKHNNNKCGRQHTSETLEDKKNKLISAIKAMVYGMNEEHDAFQS